MLDQSNPELVFALEAAARATNMVSQIQAASDPESLTKGDRSPVTLADYASQALVGALLAETFPDDTLVAEEDASRLRTMEGEMLLHSVLRYVGEQVPSASVDRILAWIDRGAGHPGHRFWTLDPIDGTKGFLRGDQYAVALALVQGGQVQLGILGCPNLGVDCRPGQAGSGVLVVAMRASGAWVVPIDRRQGFQRLAVSQQQDPHQARLMRSFEAGHTNITQIDHFVQELGIETEPVRMDSQAKYAVLAAGGGDLLLRLISPDKPDYREKIWDQAAGALILEQAGGRISDLHGRPLDFTAGRTLARNRGVLASNGHLHPAALHALEAIRA